MRRALLLLLLMAIVISALPGCGFGTRPSASATVIQAVPPPPPALLELPEAPRRLVPGYFPASADAQNATAEDVMANHKDNAQRCLDLEARYLALREWVLGLPKTIRTEARP